MLDWATISSLATAAGTLVLAVATFASVRAGSRAARVAERAMSLGMRPVLGPSRLQDPAQKVGFMDGRWLVTPGGGAGVEVNDDAVLLTLAVRNVGSGLAVLHGWHLHFGPPTGSRPDVDSFHRLTRDIYIASGDLGFWQGALREPQTEEFIATRRAVEAREAFVVDVLYGDHEGGQRAITRFRVMPRPDQEGWLATVGRHWNVDGPQAR
ncbi:MAG TPA: hypothetical protein VN193_07170 [Candidatus Angelobacter sp.]|nr:hypothetical protein [Candidatus Angelobacter sp.]